MNLQQQIDQLANLKSHLYQKDFLLTWEKSHDDLQATLLIADILKNMRTENISPRLFDTGLAVSIFRDNSTRTRFSFASAANLLGLAVQDMDETKSQIAHGETVRETANMISFLTDFIGIRDDMYLGEGNKYMRQVGEALDDGAARGVLPVRPGVINLQCDLDHPTQTMADLLHLKNHFGSLEELRGKKIVMSWAYSPSYGKPLSVPQGIIALMTRFGMNVELAHPKGYELLPEVITVAKKNAAASSGTFSVGNSMEKAMQGADIVYPKSWAPISVMQQRTPLLRQKDTAGLAQLEKDCLRHNAEFKNWEYDNEMARQTRNGQGLYMHCLPADISGVSCPQGEVSADTFEQWRITTYQQAGYKPYIIAAMMLANRFENPAQILKKILESQRSRVKY
ncbi:MAG TPA: knotted carbamoyltransferase YgeW [Bacteroidales bacterium]|nr:knotted carbamoyltransferase YgeW [Bacteroidales bacterium]